MKELIWIGDTLKEIRKLPGHLKDELGYNLYNVQLGRLPKRSKILKGIKPAVVEIVLNYNTDTYRVIYTTKLNDSIFVLHCFKKKSKKGIETPKSEIDIIKQRLNIAKKMSCLEV